MSLTVRVENSASWLTVIVSLLVNGSGMDIFVAMETKATSRNVWAVIGVEPNNMAVPIMEYRLSLSRVTPQVV